MEYGEFISSKKTVDPDTGFKVEKSQLNDSLFDFQRDIVAWSLARGRACIFADCGMGKTLMQLEWAKRVTEHTGNPVLILAPLAVTHQTIREGEKFGISVEMLVSDVFGMGIYITNYEKLHKVNLDQFSGVVLDESSILKSYTGKIRTHIIESCMAIPFRLACTATPAPNDFMELGNHSQFVGSMSRTEMLSMFFVHDGGETQKWRLKGHAKVEFWKWVCSWAVMIRKPSDLGYDDNGFLLPTLKMHNITTQVKETESADGLLFRLPASTLSERQKERKLTIQDRADECARIVASDSGQWVIWCNLNDEAKAILAAIPDAVEVSGSHSDEIKTDRMMGFSAGKYRVLVTKPKIAGHGMNWQNCNKVAFVGLSDSYEQYYQAIRRCWRFGQTKEVDCYIITAETEGAVVKNIERKERDAIDMAREMVANMHVYNEKNIKGSSSNKTKYEPNSDMVLPDFI
jgi:superfamily II DNA or RNA helicase